MALTRTSITLTDDDGSGTTGTVLNAAERVTVLDAIDGRWSEYTVTSTGSQNDFSITTSSIEADVLRCNNASSLTLTGIAAPASPAKPGKPLKIVSVGAGDVVLSNTPTASSAANEIITGSGADITLAAGVGVAYLIYDDTTDMWRVLVHEQGRPIAYTPTITSQGGTFTTVSATGRYLLNKRMCTFQVVITITTVGTATGYAAATLPFTATSQAYVTAGVNATTAVGCFGYVPASGTTVQIYKYDATQPGTSAQVVLVSGEYELP